MNVWERMLAAAVVAATMAGAGAGCDDDSYDDHDPPPGKGSLIVDNQSADDLAVYVDGQRVRDVDSFDDEAIDLDPAVHRVVLDQRGGKGNWRGDVDVVEGRRTVMDVTVRAYDSEYDVAIFFD